jgi:flagellar hook-length control protein FliK
MSILQLPRATAEPPSPPSGASPPEHPPDAHFASVLDHHRARTALAEGPTKQDAKDAPAKSHGDGEGPQAPTASQPAAKKNGDEGTATTAAVLVAPGARTPTATPASAPAGAGATPAESGGPTVALPQAGRPLPSTPVPAAGAAPAQPANAPAMPAAAEATGRPASVAAAAVGADTSATTAAPAANSGTAPLVAAVPSDRQAASVPHPASVAKAAPPATGPGAQSATPATPAQPAIPAQRAGSAQAAGVEGSTGPATSAPAAAPSAPVAAPAPVADQPVALTSQAAPAVGLDRAVETVRLALRAAAERGVTQARISLRPAELGGIDVHLRHTADGLVARVVAEHGHAAQLLEQAGAELRRSLETQGVTLLRLDIGASGEQGGRAAGEQAGFGAPGNGTRADTGGAATAEDDLPAADASPTTRLALPNGVLVDVLA